jgi:hypothetical protein
MSIVEPEHPTIRKFLTVHCPCGRDLRAPLAMAGHEISCWECHRMVPVPVPRSPERAYRVITEGVSEVFDLRWFAGLAVGAAVLAGVLCVSGLRNPLGVIVLFLGAVGYGELIRQCGVDVWDFDDWKRPGLALMRLGVALVAAVCVTAPLLLTPEGPARAPRFSTLGIVVAFVAAMLVPLAIYLVYARDENGPLGVRRAALSLLRYPLASLLPLLLLPLGVVAAEALVDLVLLYVGNFRFLILELFPDTTYFAQQHNIQEYGNYTRPYLPDARFFHYYFHRLHQGFALTSALPASLSAKTFIVASPWTLELTDGEYLWMRLYPTELVLTVLAFFAAVQARWLGALSRLESGREIAAQS